MGIFDKLEEATFGKKPGASTPGFGYLTAHPFGLGIGGGLFNNAPSGYGKLSALYANSGIGQFTDQDGNTNYGLNTEGGLLKWGIPGDGDFGLGTFQTGAFFNKNTASIGGQANIAEASKTESVFDTGNNGSVRVGLSEGEGLGLRAHYGDTNGNGAREFGFGFDAGPVSLDVKSESGWDLLSPTAAAISAMAKRDAASAASAASAQPPPAMDGGMSGGGGSVSISGTKPGGTSNSAPQHTPIGGHSGGEPLPPTNRVLDMLPAMPDGGVISNGFKSPLDLLPSMPKLPELPKISLPEGPMLDGGLTSPFADLF